MRLFLEAQSEEEKTLLGGEALKIEGAEVGIVMCKCLEGGILPKEHSFSWGNDVSWLVGKCYVAISYLTNLVRGLN